MKREVTKKTLVLLPGLDGTASGPLALMLAAKEPTKTRVILLASFVRPPRPGLARFRFAARSPVIWTVRAARRTPPILLRRWSPRLRQAKAEAWRTVSSRTLAARVREVLRVDARELLRSCKSPVGYVVASRDTVVPGSNVAEVAAIRPSVRIARVDDGHLAMFTSPDQVADAVGRMMQYDESDRDPHAPDKTASI
ncbi:MAG: alpha/beta fold hydrolase [Vicinamibacterales bacterium]